MRDGFDDRCLCNILLDGEWEDRLEGAACRRLEVRPECGQVVLLLCGGAVVGRGNDNCGC